MPRIAAERKVQRVVIAFATDDDEALAAAVARLKAMDVHIDIVPRLFDVVGPNVEVHSVEGLPLIGLPVFGSWVSGPFRAKIAAQTFVVVLAVAA